MNHHLWRSLGLTLLVGLLVSLASTSGAPAPRGQERQLPPRQGFLPSSQIPLTRNYPESPNSGWVRNYQYFFSVPGPDKYEYDDCVSVLPGGEDGIAVAATIRYWPPYPALGRADIAVLRLDPSGTVVWKTLYEADPNIQCYNEAEALIRTGDGGYLLVGDSGRDDVSATEALVMKIGEAPPVPHFKNEPNHHYSYSPLSGPVKWIKAYAITSPNEDAFVRASTVAETQDGGYLVAGGGGVAGVWIMKLDSEGNVLRHKSLSNGNWINSCSLQATLDGGFILTGIYDSQGNVEVFKLDGNAVVQWHKRYMSDVVAEARTQGEGFAVLRDGGYILTGSTSVGCSGEHSCFVGGWVCRLDQSGNIIWQRGYTEAVPAGPFETADGGFFMLDSRLGGIMKLDASGAFQWARTIADGDGGIRLAPGFQEDDGGFVIGYSSSTYDPYFHTWLGLIRLGPNGLLGTVCPLVAEGSAPEMDPHIRVTPGSDLVPSENSVQVRTLAYTPFARTCSVKVACGSPANR